MKPELVLQPCSTVSSVREGSLGGHTPSIPPSELSAMPLSPALLSSSTSLQVAHERHHTTYNIPLAAGMSPLNCSTSNGLPAKFNLESQRPNPWLCLHHPIPRVMSFLLVLVLLVLLARTTLAAYSHTHVHTHWMFHTTYSPTPWTLPSRFFFPIVQRSEFKVGVVKAWPREGTARPVIL